MRTPLLVAAPLVALAVTACEPRPQYLMAETTSTTTYTSYAPTYAPPQVYTSTASRRTDAYPGSTFDSRGYRVDAGSYGYNNPYSGGQALMAGPEPVTPAQAQARQQRERQSSGNPAAWRHNGYSYDYWGNLTRAPGGF